MMKKALYTCCAGLLLFAMTACDNYLDVKPKGYSIPQYYEDYALLLNAQKLSFMGANYVNCMTDDAVLGETGMPAGTTFDSKPEEEQNLYTFKSGDIFPQGTNDDYYVEMYKKIYTFNVVINKIMEVKDASETDKLRLRAEALVHRAFAYLQLVNVYAPQYDKATAASDWGVPLVLSEDINNSYVRNTVEEVYKRIIADLEEAAPNLPETAVNTYHPNQTTAYAVLARACLYKGDYDAALKAARLALQHNTNTIVDYKLYRSTGSGTSHIKTIVGNTTFQKKNKNPQNIFIKQPSSDPSSTIYASSDLMSTFDKDLPTGAVDKRRALFYAKDNATTYSPMSFPGYTMLIAHINAGVGITVAELYITLAECEARATEGTAANACQALDFVRDNRITGNVHLTPSTKTEALRIALDERRREFAFCGQMRFIDLRRLNKESAFAKSVSHTLNGQTYTLPANDARYIMPLPYSVREFNPSIPQYKR